MFPGSWLDQLNLVSADDFRIMGRIPKAVTKLPGFDTDGDGGSDPSGGACVSQPKRIIVSNQLPIRAHREPLTGKWSFEYDNDSLYLQLKDGFPPGTEFVYVGSLNANVRTSEQEDVAQLLLEKFQCVPTFLPVDLHNKYYHGFCKHYLWPVFHYMLPMTQSHGSLFERSHWRAYMRVNKIFADKIFEVINPEEDYVWIHDYHLMVLPTFLRNRFHRLKVGFFLHSPFPSSEIYRTLPVRDEILKGFLNCDLIGFHTFDYARHFLSCCSRMLGIDYESKRGYIGVEYFGRTVSIKILPVGIHMGQIESIMASRELTDKVKELRQTFQGKTVMLGVDDLDMFKGISLKFMAMGQLLQQNEQLREKVVLVQITNPARSTGKDVRDVRKEMNWVANEINGKFRKPGYEPIVFVNGPVSTLEKVAYYAVAECVVVNAVRDGMNLVPYKYTVTRQGSPVLDEALGYDDSADVSKSVIIVSEFIGCSPSLSGAIRVNPWNVEAVADAMSSAVTMSEAEKQLRHQKHYKYISSHDVAYWARSFDQDLQRACKDHYNKRFWGVGFGLGFRVVALDPYFRKLSVEAITAAYKRTSSRLILLDYDGTVMPQACVDKRPSNDLISLLNRLCDDPCNVVFVVSGRGKDPLSKWFGSCENLGISAEHGYFIRWNSSSEWKTCGLRVDLSWKKMALPVMNHYKEATDGSFIEEKESAMVWHHQEADPSFGSSQAKELLDHLEGVLANEPVVVKRGQHIVEVKPQGVSKGKVVENLIGNMRNSKGMRPDFLLCIGDDRSDEDMFESIVNHLDVPSIAEVFACTVGQKPSKAKYYLDDTSDVIKLLLWLADSSGEPQQKLTFPQPTGQCRTEILDL
ncbi:PREDICTED: probable alpha,alpha-trehalose-phosphate synthase [UDP-forming] 11 isoform X2 [Tarenaya hassleriana]|uniref:probable alpha,alpha-trehalose-phosphate synthase [UDP-forming] 11 isoform X1 n=1 Tax=Tarenaya hassleriana TaxID=28532 RepID=UPI00053C79BC|nr:PREDICTED: probable alpha,alpha-trehalose-phosphate synthase [UDP-forming] 11 isoform X1 [Tarenaya hassleriana]XP_010525748.1 PREDICTED: probable alpha,alpha-trehalose-phosphate synthase [UDP-forming] 11 isoform X2 [Tarenaya hassleriana]